MRATAPSGNAAYEGKVAWGGERGYGVRAPEGDQSAKDDPSTEPVFYETEVKPNKAKEIFAVTSRKPRPWEPDDEEADR